MPKSREKPNARRSRSFGGCGTCRRRHVKCDQVRPICLTCKAVGVRCEGFSAQIRWMSAFSGIDEQRESVSEGTATNSMRRHLYTGSQPVSRHGPHPMADNFSETARERMSSSLASSFVVGSVDASLSELDSRSRDKDSGGGPDLALGPFGVLNFSKAVEEDYSAVEDPSEPIVPQAAPPTEDSTIEHRPVSMDSLIGLDDTLQWADLFGFENNGNLLDSHMFDPVLDLHDTSSLTMPEQDDLPLNDPLHGPSSSYGHELDLVDLGSPSSRFDISKGDALGSAHYLLRHFKDGVMRRWPSLPITLKSPWETILFSEAINTLAHLTYLAAEHISSAKKANLYGLLAISAQHILRNPLFDWQPDRQPEYWSHFAAGVTAEAKKSLQHSLKTELRGATKAKYKDQLSAIFSLLAVAVIVGATKDARCYLVDCELLMRHRGLAKRVISRRARILHHMYTWSRILGESTYVTHDYSNTTIPCRSQFVADAMPSDAEAQYHQRSHGQGSRLDDFLRLDLHQDDNDLDIGSVKEPQVSLHDIHLEDSRENPDTLYTEIYGISETWLSLVSQTTRLANKMDAIKATGGDDASITYLLQRRATRLEDMVCSFAAQFVPRYTASKWEPNNQMHRALNSALVIFFYRRIRNVNPWILQSHVDDVIAALDSFDEALAAERSWQGPGTPWPAFMAGCEAASKAKRDKLFSWIDKGAKDTGFHCYVKAKELLLEVWKARDGGQAEESNSIASGATRRSGRALQSSASWVDVCRASDTWLMAF